MRHVPDEKNDEQYIQELNAPSWMFDLLKLNPDYVFWSNYEDVMSDDGGWSSPIEYPTFSDMFALDELNEVINFYFEVERDGHDCSECDGSGFNKDVRDLFETWFRSPMDTFGSENSGWQYQLTQDEVDVLWENGRLDSLDGFHEKPTAEQVNEWAKKTPIAHDAINRFLCVQQRAKRLGVYGFCPNCEGQSVIYDEPQAHVELQLWLIHPRKGASRGVRIKRIEQHELPEVFAFLKEAQQRFNDKFSKLPD